MNEVRTESLDHYGLVMGMIKELGIMDIVDKELPTKSESKIISHGMAVAAMILNGLGYANKQLYLTPRFFEKKALKQLFQSDTIEAKHFNKESLGRTLDKLFEYDVSKLYEKIAHKALQVLNLTPSIVHLDSTSFHLDGSYPNQEIKSKDDKSIGKDETSSKSKIENQNSEPSPVFLTQGYSRDHHPDLNQVVLNLITEHKAGIPIWMKPADGNQVDTKAFATIIQDHISSLKSAITTPIKIVSDAALFTSKTIKEFKENNMLFISRVPAKLKQAKDILQNYNKEEFVQLNDNYQAIAYVVEYEQMQQKWVLFKSNHAKSKEDKTIYKEYQKKQDQESKLLKKLQKTAYFCKADAKLALKEITTQLKCTIITEKELLLKPKYKTKGRPKKDEMPEYYEYYWQIKTEPNKEYLKQEQKQKSGLFILATNDMKLSNQELLDEYKSQQRVERGFRFLKSPQFLSDAMFLKNPKRIEAMLMIMTLSLLVYSALEYKIRQELKTQNKTFPNQLGKPIQNPTTRWIFENFHEIQIVIIKELKKQVIANLLERNVFILNLLGKLYWRYYRIENKIEKWGAQ
jgi:transposase